MSEFDPTHQYGKWIEGLNALELWDLLKKMRKIVPNKYRSCVKIVIKEKTSCRNPAIGWLYTPNMKPPRSVQERMRKAIQDKIDA